MAKKVNTNKNMDLTKEDIKINDIFDDMFKKVSRNTYDTSADAENQFDGLEHKLTQILSHDIEDLKSFAGNDLSTFIVKTLSKDNLHNPMKLQTGNKTDDQLIDELFASKDGSVFELFSERFRHKQLLFHDLDMLTEQLVELNEAINVTRDDILASDDLGSKISRILKFPCDESDRERYDNLIEEVERLERDYKLHYKLREHIVPKTLRYGESYVYIIPESKLYDNAQRLKENFGTIEFTEDDRNVLMESTGLFEGQGNSIKEKNEVIDSVMENVSFSNDEFPIPLLESNVVEAKSDLIKFNNLNDLLKKKKKDVKKDKGNIFGGVGFSDGVVDTKKTEDFSHRKGCYIKNLDPKRVIPVRIMDTIIGYYYIHEESMLPGHQCKSSSGRRKTNSLLDHISKNSNDESTIVGSLANSIIRSFNKKYLEENEEFKEMIISSLLYKDMYKKKLHYQFIPADNVVRFTINEDDEGNGTSMLYRSLFYAKLYLSLLLFNMITHITKSQDTRVHYVKQSGIDKEVVSKSMELARKIKSNTISIADLMDYSSIYGKIGLGRDIFIPEGESGERGLTMESFAGQQVDMQNEMMEMLKKSYINGTGVPSVIMNYTDEVDFAKTLVMANAKQLRRVMVFQDSINESTTHLYKLVMLYCTDFDMEDIADFEFELMKPKSLPNSNIAEILGYAEQMLDFYIKSEYGENAQGDEVDIKKDLLRKELSREILPMLAWDKVDDFRKTVDLEYIKITANKNNDTSGSDDSGY